jgi:hypothetical protein
MAKAAASFINVDSFEDFALAAALGAINPDLRRMLSGSGSVKV